MVSAAPGPPGRAALPVPRPTGPDLPLPPPLRLCTGAFAGSDSVPGVPTPVVRALFVRHAESTWNVERRWQGRADPPLSGRGRAAVRVAARSVGSVDAVITSPLRRAAETAAILSEEIGVGPVMVDDELVERDVGEWSGLTRGEIDERYPGWREAERFPDGWEHDEAVLERARRAFGRIGAEFAGADVLIVTHGGVLRALCRLAGLGELRFANLGAWPAELTDGEIRGGAPIDLLDGHREPPAADAPL